MSNNKKSQYNDNIHYNNKQRRVVLSEEEYTTTLSSIVQRDYFPEIPNLERQAALLERRSQGDVSGAVAVRRAARRLAEHEEVLAEIEANDENDLDEETNLRRRARPLHQESITGFHARATNEDDEEFDSNQKKEVLANRERLEKLFRSEEKAPKNTFLLTNNMASDQFDIESNRIAASEWNKPSVRNALFLPPPTPLVHNSEQNGTGSTKLLTYGVSHENKKKTSYSLDMTMPPPPNKPNQKNSLMIPARQNIPISKHALVEYIPKHALEKRIDPTQTRFPDKIIPRATGILAAAAAAGNESETDGSLTDASTDLDAPMRSIEQERKSLKRKQDRDKKSYVTMTPIVIPGAGNESPITTWGTVDSTPIVLSGQEHHDVTEGGASASAFSLSNENERERAARKAEKELARRAKRAKTPNRSVSSLTPAALSLLQKTKRTPSRTRDAFASSLRSSYTPKTRATRTSSSRRQSDSAHNATPLISRKQK